MASPYSVLFVSCPFMIHLLSIHKETPVRSKSVRFLLGDTLEVAFLEHQAIMSMRMTVPCQSLKS